MTCEACTRARKHPKYGLFHAGCEGCAARSLARTPQFFQAAKEGRLTPEYRMALTNLLPALPTDAAHQLVKDWSYRLAVNSAVTTQDPNPLPRGFVAALTPEGKP